MVPERRVTVVGRVMQVTDGVNAVTFALESGCLRLFRKRHVVVKLVPPHSWTLIASVSNNEHWGTRPSQDDLALILHVLRSEYSVRTDTTSSGGVQCIPCVLEALKRRLRWLSAFGSQ
jgi:hypothetical protein